MATRERPGDRSAEDTRSLFATAGRENHREALRAQSPLDGAAVARELRRGRVPPDSGIILR